MKNQEYFRIDKNIAHNINYISRYHNDRRIVDGDSGLIKNLIYYFCYSYQNNLFNFGSLDVQDFAQKFGYSVKYLNNPHQSPAQLKGKTQDEIEGLYQQQENSANPRPIYDSILENALYILHTKPIVFERGAKTVDYQNNKIVYTTDSNSYLILPELKVTTIGKIMKQNNVERRFARNQGNKKIYQYALEQSFIENLSHYYLKGAKESLLQLRKTSLDDLYLYLLNLRSNLQYQKIYQTTAEKTPNFELLCDLANIKTKYEDGREYPPRYRKRDLNQALKKIVQRSEMNFDVKWVKAGHLFAYTPLFSFQEPEQKNPAEERNHVFKTRLAHELLDTFKILDSKAFYSDNRNENLMAWLKNTTLNEKEKKLAYETAYFKTFGQLAKYMDSMKDAFMRKCADINSLQDIS